MKFLSKIKMFLVVALAAFVLIGCGQRVEVPVGHVGKILTQNGYKEGIVSPSLIRLERCVTYCDRMVVLDVSDRSYNEGYEIFIPKDKLKMNIGVGMTLRINPEKSEAIFGNVVSQEQSSYLSKIEQQIVYKTYAQNVVEKEVRELLTNYSIEEIASNLEVINEALRERLSKQLQTKTPFVVSNITFRNPVYPKIITDAQEKAAESREQIETENNRAAIVAIQQDNALKEEEKNRAIEEAKAKTLAVSNNTVNATITDKLLELKRLENEAEAIRRWDGKLPANYTVLGGSGKESLPSLIYKVGSGGSK